MGNKARISIYVILLSLVISMSFFITSTSAISKKSSREPLIVEKEVQELLINQNKVPVVIELVDNVNYNSINKVRSSVKNNQDRVLSRLSKDDFSLKYKYSVSNMLAGDISKSGLNKLRKNNLVKKVYYDKEIPFQLQESTVVINADDAWLETEPNSPETITGNGQTICMPDSGIDYTHSDLGGNFGLGYKVKGGYDYVDNDNDPMDTSSLSHGTHIAGIVAANGVIKGVAPDADLIAIRVGADLGGLQSDIIAGVDDCINNKSIYGTTAISISIADGFEYDNTTCSLQSGGWLDQSLNIAYANNIPVIIASGNNGFKSGISYPACNQNTISVGASYDTNQGSGIWTGVCSDNPIEVDMVGCGSNTGSNLDLMAPGGKIYSTIRTASPSNYTNKIGTSMSAPHVAGTIALMKQMNPNLTVDQILNILKSTGTTVTDTANGLQFPRVDTLAAVQAVNPNNLPDVMPEPASVSGSNHTTSSTIYVSFNIMNNGPAIANNIFWVLDPDSASASGVFSNTNPISLNPGEHVRISTYIQYTTSNTYNPTIYIDPSDLILENNEINNQENFQLIITSPSTEKQPEERQNNFKNNRVRRER